MGTEIDQLLPKDAYDAAVNANAPTAANPFATIDDVSGGNSMVVSFAAGTSMEVNTDTVGYIAKAQFIYAGSDAIGTILTLKANIWKNIAGGATGQIKIVDITNGNDIVNLTGIENLFDATVLDLGAIANIPTDAAVFEVQIGISPGPPMLARTVSVASIILGY